MPVGSALMGEAVPPQAAGVFHPCHAVEHGRTALMHCSVSYSRNAPERTHLLQTFLKDQGDGGQRPLA